jgi:peptidoglycan LD-endopeptidase CwlK
MYKFSNKSLSKLNNKKFHPILRTLLTKAIETTPIDFTIIETARTKEQQVINFKNGTSKTMRSRHLPEVNKSGYAEAVDIAPYPVNWADIKRFKELSAHIKKTADLMNIKIEWGGDWKTFKDYPHWQLKA